MKLKTKKHRDLVINIRKLVEQARENVIQNINVELLYTYWCVGKLIVATERHEKYDESSVRQMLLDLSQQLTTSLGKGFSRSQLTYMRVFYLRFRRFEAVPAKKRRGLTLSNHQPQKRIKPIGLTVSNQLSWSHYHELLKCNNDNEIIFYQRLAVIEKWSVRDLRRQIDSALFERVALSKNSKGIMKTGNKGKIIDRHAGIGRDPYVLEFLNIPENNKYNEKHLEQKIIDNLQQFILEIGKGFAFICRQFRITLNNKHMYVDLVFYHRILRCFVLIDLKVKAVRHHDIGQMNLYLNYFEAEQNQPGDNPPIGIILSKYKDDITVEYAIKGISNKILVSKYELYLPDKKMLQQRVERLLAGRG